MRRILLAIISTILFCNQTIAQDLVLFVTSNLEGRFTLHKETSDPMLLLLQSLYKEREKKPPLLFIDAGNAFHPGALSRYSYGSVTHDYLDINGCDASLVSSRDLRIGLDSLLQMQQRGKKFLLSANIQRNDKQLFKPYTVTVAGEKKIAIIGISNDNAIFDITEKNISSVKIESYSAILEKTLSDISANEKCNAVIVLSGLSTDKNAAIMKKYPTVSLIISGGDAKGDVYGTQASQILFPDGRRILMTDARRGYFKAECSFRDSLIVNSFTYKDARAANIKNENYLKFEKRLAIWKDKYQSEEASVFDKRKPFQAEVTPEKVAHVMRHTFRTELGIVRKDTLAPFSLSESSTNFQIVQNVDDDYLIYTYRIKGESLLRIIEDQDNIVAGLKDERVQGRKILSDKSYTVASTQAVYEDLLKKGIASETFKNQWISIADLLIKDIGGKAATRRKTYEYLDSRYALLVSASIRNMLSSEKVSSGPDISTPVGTSSTTSTIWGIDDSLTVVAYNNFHKFTLNPSICLTKENKKNEEINYPNNLMKGIFVYQYKFSDLAQPYHKSQYESLVFKVDGKRSSILRETVGADFETSILTSKAGFGFEKKYRDTPDTAAMGFEFTTTIKYPFDNGFKYIAAVDSFFSKGHNDEQTYFRLSVTNGFEYELTQYINASIQYRIYRYYEKKTDENYSSRLLTFMLGFATDFKVF